MRDRTSSEVRAHQAALVKIRDRWLYDGEITIDEKRRLISEENLFFFGADRVSPATGKTLTDDSGLHAYVDPQLELVPRQPFEDEPEPEPWWQR